jgi:phage-related protein
MPDGHKFGSSLGGKVVSGFGSTIKKGFALAAKAGIATISAASAGIGAIVKSSASAYADYEQNIGGIETLFKDNADTIVKYASEAYKTAGISANDYMQNVTSFSASLLQGLGGDTAQAAEIANEAMVDMSDNANKMGTDISSIQNAYQGFAKQNYTMLDNLKLGYSGTQSEMARLINDSGVLGDSIKVDEKTVNSVSFDKMIEAIHKVQTDLDITGTTSKEAATTVSGSLGSVKAAWANLMAGMGDKNADLKNLIKEMVSTVKTFAKNILPVIKQALSGVTTLISELAPDIAAELPQLVSDLLPQLIEAGTQIFQALVKGISDNIGTITQAAITAITTIATALIQNTGPLVQALAEQVTADKANVAENAAKVAEDRTAAETAAQTAQAVADSLPEDYVTAVAKIAENTAEIASVKLTDKELQRRVDALFDIGQGVTHRFETDTDTAYQKTVPTGGKLMSVKSVSGRSIVWNQLISQLIEAKSASVTGAKLTDKTLQISGTSTNVVFLRIVPVQTAIIGHKYLFHSHASDTAELSNFNGFYNNESETDKRFYEYGKGTIFTNADNAIEMRLRLDADVTVNFQITPQLFDLTAMFGSGNEPTTVEEFEAMFPATYYPYNAGEIVSAGVTEVAVGDTAFPIPEAIKALPGYGWSAGTARNYVDYENKRYVQCVNSVDLGTLTWTAGGGISSQTVFIASSRKICGQKLSYNSAIASNILCSKYLAKSQNEVWSDAAPVGIATNATIDGYVYVNDTAYTDATAFKQAMQGVMLYYELESPIVTDISTLIDDDFLRNLTVETGGSITFKGGNDDYRIPVPSEEEYIVKLSEIGGTT